MANFILAYDIGSSSCKACLFEIDKQLNLIDTVEKKYPIYSLPDGGMEQDPDDWWEAMVLSNKEIFQNHRKLAGEIAGISFCTQMQGLVLVDKNLRPLRRAMSYMDQRAGAQKKALLEQGLLIEGMNAFKLIKSLRLNGAIAASVKDPIWKYKWVEENEPKIFEKLHFWLDVKEYLIARATGECVMTEDSAFATFMTTQKNNQTQWSPSLMKMYRVNPKHLPPIKKSTDVAGHLRKSQADELGLSPGVPVFGGGGDASMTAIGAGAINHHDTYIYSGTSAWVSSTVTCQKVDVNARVATIVGARQGYYHYFAEQETAGKCFDWAKDHIVKDEINLYSSHKTHFEKSKLKNYNIYDFLIESIGDIPPGSGGLIFTPWLHGNRSPFEDPLARGMFFNLTLETGKKHMIRSVVEGVIFHIKWLLESIKKSFPISDVLGFTGGSAQSSYLAQMLSDIIEHPIELLKNPQNGGARGAALTAAIGLGFVSGFSKVKDYIQKHRIFEPDLKHRELYQAHFEVFKDLYLSNKKNFNKLNHH